MGHAALLTARFWSLQLAAPAEKEIMCCSWLLDAQFPWDYLCLPVLASALGCPKMSADGVCRVGTRDGGDAGKPSPPGCCAACASWGPLLAELGLLGGWAGAGFEVGFAHGEEVREVSGWAERVGWQGEDCGVSGPKATLAGAGLSPRWSNRSCSYKGVCSGWVPPSDMGARLLETTLALQRANPQHDRLLEPMLVLSRAGTALHRRVFGENCFGCISLLAMESFFLVFPPPPPPSLDHVLGSD